MITDINVRFNNWVQDFYQDFNNTSTIYVDGVPQDATEDSGVEWTWVRVDPDGIPVILDHTFNLNIGTHTGSLYQGVSVLGLIARDPQTGKTWHRVVPVFCQPSFFELPPSPWVALSPAVLSLNQWAANASKEMSHGPHWSQKCFKANLPGDINGDGVVDFTDLNLLLSIYGFGKN